jgi:hypothetical protein
MRRGNSSREELNQTLTKDWEKQGKTLKAQEWGHHDCSQGGWDQ